MRGDEKEIERRRKQCKRKKRRTGKIRRGEGEKGRIREGDRERSGDEKWFLSPVLM